MRLLILLTVFCITDTFAQFPTGRYYSIFPDRAAITTLDSSSISLEGGTPIFDHERKTITLDSSQKGQGVHIVKLQSTSKTTWRIVGKVTEPERTVFAIIDLVMIDPETFELNFNKEEYTTAEEAESHLKDSAVSFGFRFMSEGKVHRVMSLRPLKELTPQDMILVYRSANDSIEALKKQLEGQPEIAFFAMLTRPMQIMMDELVAKGYNPLVAQTEAQAILAKLKENPEVKKVMDEIELKNDGNNKE